MSIVRMNVWSLLALSACLGDDTRLPPDADLSETLPGGCPHVGCVVSVSTPSLGLVWIGVEWCCPVGSIGIGNVQVATAEGLDWQGDGGEYPCGSTLSIVRPETALGWAVRGDLTWGSLGPVQCTSAP